jgi:hypothetical protein
MRHLASPLVRGESASATRGCRHLGVLGVVGESRCEREVRTTSSPPAHLKHPGYAMREELSTMSSRGVAVSRVGSHARDSWRRGAREDTQAGREEVSTVTVNMGASLPHAT